MAANPVVAFVKDLFGKIIDAAKSLPALFLFVVLVVVTLLVGVIAMAVLHVDLQNNVLWLLGIVIIVALIGWLLVELKGKPRDPVPSSEPAPSTISPSTQRIIYDSTKSSGIAFDFTGKESPIYKGTGSEARPVTPIGRGELTSEEAGTLSIYRSNTDGRFEIRLRRYSYLGAKRDHLPKNVSIGGSRNLELSFEAKVSPKGVKHTLKAILKNDEREYWLATAEKTVTDNDWRPFKMLLPADNSSLDCYLRIDDQNVSQSGSSVQLRNILLVEHPE
jgi:hypothetical protein